MSCKAVIKQKVTQTRKDKKSAQVCVTESHNNTEDRDKDVIMVWSYSETLTGGI